jgi:hypothetical protein
MLIANPRAWNNACLDQALDTLDLNQQGKDQASLGHTNPLCPRLISQELDKINHISRTISIIHTLSCHLGHDKLESQEIPFLDSLNDFIV